MSLQATHGSRAPTAGDDATAPAPVPLRLGVLMALRPRKLGSLEAWMLAFAEEAHARGHRVDVFGRDPIHPTLTGRLAAVGTRFFRLEELERRPVRGAIRLARNYDVLHLNLFAPRDRVALIARAAWPARVLFVDHISGPTGTPAPRPAYKRWLDRLSMARVGSVAGVSNYVRDRAARRFGIDDARTLYNGVDVSRFSPPMEREDRGGEPRIMCVANLIPEKGVHHLIGAVAKLREPRPRLVVVGDGPEAGRLEERARALDVAESTEFLGLRNDVDELLRDTDVFVHPAVWAEAFGLTILEAMAAGCPVVASDVGGIPELIEDGVSGVLVPPGDEESLARALQRLLDDRAARDRFGANARRRAEDRFSLAASVQRHLEWCEEYGTPRR